jgi:hypothetical protein
MTEAERQALIERYTEGHQIVLAALEGISDAIRLRRLLAEDNPVIGGYDEEAFARVLRYADRPIAAALDALSAARRTTAEILAQMTPADWSRAGTHTQSGPYSAEDWLEIYATHAHDHAAQIRRARGQTS